MEQLDVAAYESVTVRFDVRVESKTWATNDRVMVWGRTAADQGDNDPPDEVVETYVLEATASDHSMLRSDRWQTIEGTIPTHGTATMQVFFGVSGDEGGGERAFFDNFIVSARLRQLVEPPDCSHIAGCTGRYQCLVDDRCVAMAAEDDSCSSGSLRCRDVAFPPPGEWKLRSWLFPQLEEGRLVPDRGFGASVAIGEDGSKIYVGDPTRPRYRRDESQATASYPPDSGRLHIFQRSATGGWAPSSPVSAAAPAFAEDARAAQGEVAAFPTQFTFSLAGRADTSLLVVGSPMDSAPLGDCAYDGQCQATHLNVAGGAVGAVRTMDFGCSCPVQANRSAAALIGDGSVLSARCVPGEWLCLEACSGHGLCQADGGCECDPKYAGRYCERCADGRTLYPDCLEASCFPDPCTGHGSCAGGQCSCDVGYAGAACDSCAVGFLDYPQCNDDPCTPDPCKGASAPGLQGSCNAGLW